MGNSVGPNDPRGNAVKLMPRVGTLEDPANDEVGENEVGPNDPRDDAADAAVGAAGQQSE